MAARIRLAGRTLERPAAEPATTARRIGSGGRETGETGVLTTGAVGVETLGAETGARAIGATRTGA